MTTTAGRTDQPANVEMRDDDDSILSIEVGGQTIGANLDAAIAAGDVIRHADGKLELARPRPPSYIRNDG
ncbi:MAG TPA: hypothetical protein VMR17_01735, partial [Xanthobacteraceae bacterium]|nr:hypothetical protein [Xanthobacteraceae bacterium]